MTRQEAVRMIENDIRIHHDYLSGNYRKALRMAISALAQPERPKGKWGEHGECPFCGYLRQWEDDRFCGNCGADMRGDKDEID